MLAGCYTAREATLESIPNDYRQRHPIVLKEAPRTVELFIGNRRGTLTATQRAEVLAFAQAWRREATGGILIDVPTGTPNAAQRRGRAAGGPLDPGRRRRAARGGGDASQHRQRSAQARDACGSTIRR